MHTLPSGWFRQVNVKMMYIFQVNLKCRVERLLSGYLRGCVIISIVKGRSGSFGGCVIISFNLNSLHQLHMNAVLEYWKLRAISYSWNPYIPMTYKQTDILNIGAVFASLNKIIPWPHRITVKLV